jgi:hypothetical protein
VKSTKSLSSIERLLGAGPMAVPPHAFACSETALTYARFEREGEGLVLVRHHSEELPADTFQHGLLGGPPREPRSFEERVAAFVERLGGAVEEASLVLPDAWLRTAFAEVAELPSDSRGRDEVLRWKLKRLVPFRVDELRVRATEVTPLAGQEEPRRVFLGFGLEGLFSHLEHAFRATGVRIGRIANEGLSAIGALSPEVCGDGEGALTAMMLVSDRGYTLVAVRGDEPVLHRFKGFTDALPEDARAASVVRDLRLTATFLEEHYPGLTLERLVLAAPDETAARWGRWIDEGGLARVELLGSEQTVPLRVGAGVTIGSAALEHELLPLVGAVCQEVAA